MKKVEAAEFTKAMKATHTILLPDMLHYHNALLQAAFDACGYHLEILPEEKNLPGYSLPYISGDYPWTDTGVDSVRTVSTGADRVHGTPDRRGLSRRQYLQYHHTEFEKGRV